MNQDDVESTPTDEERRAARVAAQEQSRKKRRSLRNDAILLSAAAGVFLVIGIAGMIAASYQAYPDKGFKPVEVFSMFAFSAATVLGVWAYTKFFRT